MIVRIIKYYEFHQQVRIFDDSCISHDLSVKMMFNQVTTDGSIWTVRGSNWFRDILYNLELDPFDWLKTIYNWGSEWQAVKLDYKSQKLYKSRK